MSSNVINDYYNRPASPVQLALRELHLLGARWLAQSSAPRSLAARMQRFTFNASVAMRVATIGGREKHHLGRARESLASYLETLGLLVLEGHLSEPHYCELLRRTHQVLKGIDVASTTPPSQWVTIPIREVAADSDAGKTELLEMKQIVARVARLADTNQTDSAMPRAAADAASTNVSVKKIRRSAASSTRTLDRSRRAVARVGTNAKPIEDPATIMSRLLRHIRTVRRQ
jgi:hypothetical protein